MQMTTEARAWLDETVRRILARHPLRDDERTGISYELMSHLHSVGESFAKSAGRTEVSKADVEAAYTDAGGDEGLASAFVQALAKPIERVLFWRRLGAFSIDMVLVLFAVSFVHTVLALVFAGHSGAMAAPDEFAGDLFVPWGFHDPTMPLAVQAIFTVVSAAALLSYFAFFDAHLGRTPGKFALQIRVVRVDGRPMGYRQAFLRNLAKLSPPILLLDTIVMLLAFQKTKQRVSDQIAKTIVVRA